VNLPAAGRWPNDRFFNKGPWLFSMWP